MSRVTLVSLLLAVMLAIGIHLWTMQQRDACSPYLSGDTKAPQSEWVMEGSREVEVSCRNWIERQSLTVQILCMLDGVIVILFLVNALSDLKEWLEARQRMGGVV